MANPIENVKESKGGKPELEEGVGRGGPAGPAPIGGEWWWWVM